MKVEVLYKTDSILGEGPVWNHVLGVLLWVDIERAELHQFNTEKQLHNRICFNSRISVVVPTTKQRYIIAMQNGLAFYNPLGNQLEYIADPEKLLPNNRFNDGKCDAKGRLWVGSMDLSVQQGKGNLYCLDKNLQPLQKLSELTISNGIAWNKNNTKMYFIDTATYCVSQFNYELETGNISRAKTVIKVPVEHGAPDGMCIDEEGMLWIAHWGGNNVSRWNPNTGELMEKVEIPTPHVTSCCFGGDKLDTLFITTARIGFSEEELKKYPLSGSIFQFKPGVKGSGTIFFNE